MNIVSEINVLANFTNERSRNATPISA